MKEGDALAEFEATKTYNRKEIIRTLKDLDTDNYNKLIISRNFNEYGIISYDMLDHLPNNTFSEVLYQGDLTNRLYRFYLDIDMKINEGDFEDAYNNMINALKASVEIINNTLIKSQEGLTALKFEDLILLNGCGYTADKSYKFSYHIIYKTVLFAELTHIINLLTYLIDTTFKDYSYKKHRLVDTRPYVSNKYLTYNFKLPNQSKPNEPKRQMKIENGTYSDSIITISKTNQRFILDNTNLINLINRKAIDRKIIKDDIADIVNIRDPNLSQNIKQKIINTALINQAFLKRTTKYNQPTRADILRRITASFNSGIIREEVSILLDTIANTYENQLDFTIWLNIIYLLKRIEISNNIDLKHIAEDWTASAYFKEYKRPKEQQKNAEHVAIAKKGFIKIWDSIKIADDETDNKFNLINLYNIAIFYNKNIRKDIVYSKNFNRLYNIDYTSLNYVDIKQLADDERLSFKEYINYQTITTNAGMGEGKTQATFDLFINALECGNENTFTFIASNRILYGKAIQANFNNKLRESNKNPVIFYQDLQNELRKGRSSSDILKEYSGVICSFESIGSEWIKPFWKEFLKTKNEIYSFFDESETLIESIFSNLNHQQQETIRMIRIIWGKSIINIAVDAFYSIKTYDFVRDLNEYTGRTKSHIHIDTKNRNKHPKTITITDIIDEWDDDGNAKGGVVKLFKSKIIDYLKDPINRIVVVCEKYGDINAIKSVLNELYKDPIFNLTEAEVADHSGGYRENMTVEELQANNDILTSKTGFSKKRLWIYNMSIANGVSVEEEYFNKGICMINNFGISSNSILNAIGRARKTTEWDISIIANKKNININNTTDINKIRSLIIDKHSTVTSKDEYEDVSELLGDIEQNKQKIETYNRLNADTKRYYKYETAEAIEFYEYDTDKMRMVKPHFKRFKLEIELYKLYIKQLSIVADIKQDNINKNIKINSQFELNFNLQDKANIFQDLTKLKNYKVEYKLQNIDEATATIATDTQEIIDKSNYDLINDIKHHPKYNKEEGELFNMDKTIYKQNLIDANYIINGETADIIDKIKLIVSTGKYSRLKRYEDNWKIIKNKINKNTDKFKYSIFKGLLDIFKIADASLLPSSLNSKEIKEDGLYEKIKPLAEEYRRTNKKPLITSQGSHRSFITELNNLIEPIGLKYKQLEKVKGNTDRLYTYELEGEVIELTGKFADNQEYSVSVNISTLDILKVFDWYNTKIITANNNFDDDNIRGDQVDFIPDDGGDSE